MVRSFCRNSTYPHCPYNNCAMILGMASHFVELVIRMEKGPSKKGKFEESPLILDTQNLSVKLVGFFRLDLNIKTNFFGRIILASGFIPAIFINCSMNFNFDMFFAINS